MSSGTTGDGAITPGLGKRLVRQTLHVASGRVAGLVVWIVFTPSILRTLGPEVFGIWSLFFALTGYLGALDFGLVQGTVRHVAAARERGSHDEAGAFATLGLLGFAVLGAIWLAVTLTLRERALEWLRIPPATVDLAMFATYAGAAVFALAGFTNVTVATAQGYGRFDLANQVVLLVAFQQAVGMALVLWQGWGLRGLVINVGCGWALGALLGTALLHRAVPAFRWGSPRAAVARLSDSIAFGRSMQISNLMGAIHLQLDKFLLSRFVGLASVTPYELGARVALSASTIPGLLLGAVLPAAAAMHAAGDLARLRDLYERGSRYVLTTGAITMAALVGAADRLILAWLGPGHAASAGVLRALALGFAAALATGMGTTIARGIGRPDLEARFAVLVVGLHLALSLWLVPRLGLAGALVAWVLSNGVGMLYFLWTLAALLRWSRVRLVFTLHAVPALAGGAGACAAWLLGRAIPPPSGGGVWLQMVLLAALGAAVAAVVIGMSRYLDWSELRRVLGPGPRAAATVE